MALTCCRRRPEALVRNNEPICAQHLGKRHSCHRRAGVVARGRPRLRKLPGPAGGAPPRPQPDPTAGAGLAQEVAPPRPGLPSRARLLAGGGGGLRPLPAAPRRPPLPLRPTGGRGSSPAPDGGAGPAPARRRPVPPRLLIGCRPGGGSRGSRLAPLSGALARAELSGRHGRERRPEPGR